MPSVDTNCLLRWLLDDVPAQTVAVDELLRRHRRLVVSDVALIEVVFVLERVLHLDRLTVTAAIETLSAQSGFSFDRARWSQVLPAYLAHPKLSVTDVYLAHEAARRDSLPLMTFDRKLATQLDTAELV